MTTKPQTLLPLPDPPEREPDDMTSAQHLSENGNLQHLAHIFTADPDSDQPDVVVSVPPGSELDESSDMPGPLSELNQAIHDAVLWHSATGCS